MIVFLAYFGCDELCWPRVLGALDGARHRPSEVNTGTYNGPGQ